MPPRTPEPRTIPGCIAVDGETCRDHARSSRLEWLETNGTGGFAMGTGTPTSTQDAESGAYP